MVALNRHALQPHHLLEEGNGVSLGFLLLSIGLGL